MPQGGLKKAKAAGPRRPPANPGLKKGKRTIAPKKASLMKQVKLRKKFSTGLTAQTEKALAEKAGHLELLKGGKADRNKGKTDVKKAKGTK